MRTTPRLCLFLFLAGLATLAIAQKPQPTPSPKGKPESAAANTTARELPGVKAGGRILLPTQWSLKPAGKQIKLGDFPVNIQLHPKLPYAAILHAGYGENEIVIVDLKEDKVVSRASVPQAFYGIAFAPSGEHVYCSGGEYEVVHGFRFKDGYLSEHKTFPIADPKEKFVPSGISVDNKGEKLFVCCAWGSVLKIVPIADPTKMTTIEFEKDSYPYYALPSPDGKKLYVSLWGAAGVAVVNLETNKIEATWPTDSHPTEMLFGPKDLLYVACANSNNVWVFDIDDAKALEVIGGAIYPTAPLGATPNSLALSADGKALLIANANTNHLSLVDVSVRGKSKSLGLIPVGWYPTSVRFDHTGERILVANGKGVMSKANPQGPNPLASPPASTVEYIGGLFKGTLGIIDNPDPGKMAAYTKTVFECSPLDPENKPRAAAREADNPIPAKVGDRSPIKHCIYIIKENRTYDQVFGDMPQGNGDKNLCIFPENVTPNHHALAREFVLLDNFYVESEVSADGHEWSMAAYATDFTEKLWPLSYRGSRYKGKIGYPSEGSYKISASAGGYIWDLCAEAGVTYRSYGEWIANGKNPGDPGVAKVKALEGHFDPKFRSYDLDYKDVDRAARFIEELKEFETKGEMPRFIVLRLPNDHTSGTAKGKPTPTAYVADNDLALGQVVEALSQSKFWKDLAIFVVEDDAQNGSDHVDAHRTVALAISPYIRRGSVDSNMYSTASMLRTMELILGLKPMTQFDAAALPMYASFQAKPDLTPYKARPNGVPLDTLNKIGVWGQQKTSELDLSKEDAADDLVFNEIIWRSVRGPDSKMPPPVRASFVFRAPGGEEEDEDDDDD